MLLQEYAKPGSDIYYVLQQVPKAKQIPYLALHSLGEELHKISECYQDLKTAQHKLAWWMDEIQRLYQGKALHPLTCSLANYLDHYPIKAVELLALVEAALLATRTQIFTNASELTQHYQHTGGILATLKAKILFAEDLDVALLKQMHQLGISLEMLRHLLYFPIFLARQHLYLPLSLFQKHGLDPQPILQGKGLECLRPLFDEELMSALSLMAATLEALPAEQKPHLRPLLLEAKLKKKQMHKIAADAWKTFSYRLELTPLVKLFLTRFS